MAEFLTDVFDGVGFFRSLVVPQPDDPGEPQRHPGFILRTALDVAVGDLHHDLGADEDRARPFPGFECQQALSHVAKLLVGQALEGLAELDEFAVGASARGQMVVGKPPVTPAVTPIRRHDHQVQGLRRP